MNLTAEQQADEVDKINSPSIWPFFPILPVKLLGRPGLRKGGDHDHGIILASEVAEKRPVIYIVNLFSLKPGDLHSQLVDLPTIKFDSVEAMVAEGWVGD